MVRVFERLLIASTVHLYRIYGGVCIRKGRLLPAAYHLINKHQYIIRRNFFTAPKKS